MRWLRAASRALPLVLLALTWLAVLTSYRPLHRFLASDTPPPGDPGAPDSVLAAIGRWTFTTPPGISPEALPARLDDLRAGRAIPVPGSGSLRHGPVRSASDLDMPGRPTDELRVASLDGAAMLLHAPVHLRRAADDSIALEHLLGLAAVERGRRLPLGHLWNDHAIAARVAVIAEVWRRHRGRLGAADREAVLRLALRDGERLASPPMYMAATNHGLMQAIALLQLATAFPGLGPSPAWDGVARARIGSFVPYYVASDGVVLEHSAGYQELGVRLLAIAESTARVAGRPLDAGVSERRALAQRVLGTLLRADGSLPVTGDTEHRVGGVVPRGWCELPCAAPSRDTLAVMPVGGLAIWKEGAARVGGEEHMLVVGGRFMGHAHRHSDDLSVHYRTSGTEWLSASGYWPYGGGERDDAVGWNAANGPHVRGESWRDDRRTRLEAVGRAGGIVAVRASSATSSGTLFTRTVIRLGPDSLLLLDAWRGAPAAGVLTAWQAGPDVTLEADGDAWRLASRAGERSLRVAGDVALERTIVSGDRATWLGWQVHARVPTPWPTLAVAARAPEGRVVVALGTWGRGMRLAAPTVSGDASVLRMVAGADTLAIEVGPAAVTVRSARRGPIGTVTLDPVPYPAVERRAIDSLFSAAVAAHPIRYDELPIRLKVTLLLLGGLVMLEVGSALARLWSPVAEGALRALALVAIAGAAVVVIQRLGTVFFSVVP
ncbi:MAG: heparinase II/III family protein [Gemmatimonadales bacterium]|nr:heparinase II/III family protein [Gemmatimonadales bacterium]